MTDVLSILDELERRDVRVTSSGRRLHVDAPVGILNSSLVQRLRENKTKLVAIVKVREVLAGRRRLRIRELMTETGLRKDSVYHALGELYRCGEVSTDYDGFYWLAEHAEN